MIYVEDYNNVEMIYVENYNHVEQSRVPYSYCFVMLKSYSSCLITKYLMCNFRNGMQTS